MAKVKAGLVHSLSVGHLKKNVKALIDALSGDSAVDLELKDGSSVKLSLPTSDPGVAGQLWADEGAVKVSAGS